MVDRLDNSEFTLLGEFEEAPEIEYEPEYECPPAGPGIYFGPMFAEYFMAGFADGVKTGLENMCPCKPAPIEVEAEVIKTEINKPTKGLLGDG